jgi:hypothetical protein
VETQDGWVYNHTAFDWTITQGAWNIPGYIPLTDLGHGCFHMFNSQDSQYSFCKHYFTRRYQGGLEVSRARYRSSLLRVPPT